MWCPNCVVISAFRYALDPVDLLGALLCYWPIVFHVCKSTQCLLARIFIIKVGSFFLLKSFGLTPLD